jgi:putative ABC transport system substrate-binding protein
MGLQISGSNMNDRRKLVIALGASALTAPFGCFAQQQGKVWRVGFLSPFPSGDDQQFEAFKQQLRDLGHVEGKSITIDYRSAEGNYDRLPALAADLVRRNVDVIMAAGGTPAATAAKNAARTTPVVFVAVADPVGQGIVASLARPGGNVTGISVQHPESAAKSLALLKEAVPSAKRIAILSNPLNSSLPLVIQDMQAAARTLRLEVTVVDAGTPGEFEAAFAQIVRNRADGVAILADPMFSSEAGRLTTLAAKHRLPTMGGNNSVPESGGLMSYGANRLDLVRRAAILVDKILKGAKPNDLPVEQPTKFELIVNLKAAKALGVKIPQSILLRADKLIK